MKITNLMSMLAAATAVGFCMSATAGDGQSGKLVLTDPVTHVNVTTSTKVGGDWEGDPPAVSSDGNYFEIDTDVDSTNQFTATSGITTGKVVTCEFVLKPSPVSCTGTPPAPDGGAQVAFCIATNTSTGASSFQAYVNGGWQQLGGLEVPTESEDYTLKITLDYSGSTKYAKFAIGETVLTNGSNQAWFQTANSTNCVTEYCFVGSGSLKSILTTGRDIKAEEATVGGHAVGIPEEVVQAIGGGNVDTAASTLSDISSVNTMTKLENYIIFGMNGNAIKEETKAVAKAATTVGEDGAIKLDFTNVAAKEVSGTTVNYRLWGKGKRSDAWTSLVGPTADRNAVKISTSHQTTYKIFKVEVTVGYN